MKNLILLSFILMPMFGWAQDVKWWKITGNDVAVIGTQTISGAFDGWNQNIEHHHWGRGKPFYDINTSWQRKYKDWPEDTRSKYFLSKSVLAFTTDGFHMTRTVSRTATLATIAIVASDWREYPKTDRWKVVAKKVILSIISNRISFLIIYK